PGDEPIPQNETSCSLLAAGLGSTYICADLFGLRPSTGTTKAEAPPVNTLPPALRRVDESGQVDQPKKVHAQRTSPAKLFHAIDRANSWMEKNYKIDIGPKCFYFLYGLERYKSFQEMFDGSENKSPQWYNDGYEFLAAHQGPDGSWNGYCGAECDTAFATLLLLRSTQKNICENLG